MRPDINTLYKMNVISLIFVSILHELFLLVYACIFDKFNTITKQLGRTP
jgi:hypothetical protein